MAEDYFEDPSFTPDELTVAGDDAADWMIDDPVTTESATLEALHQVTRSLVTAGNRAEVCRLAVAASQSVLGLPLSGIHVASGNRLVPVAVSEDVVDLFGEVPAFARSDVPAWQAYESSEPVVIGKHDEYRTVELPDRAASSGVMAPLGEHGVFLMNSPEERRLTEPELSFALTLAANTEAAMETAQREAKLQRQNERLETFAEMVSHDMRNPLTMLKGNLELAQETGDEQYLDKVVQAADRMDELIDQMLALARSADPVDDVDWIDLETVAREAWAETPPGGELSSAFPDGVRIAADPDRLRQILVNLFRNAIEHGGDPAITVEIEDDLLYVADDGDGIPPANREDVFEYGYTSEESGNGLGLRIVAELASAHEWEVSATESDAGGARIEIGGIETRHVSG